MPHSVLLYRTNIEKKNTLKHCSLGAVGAPQCKKKIIRTHTRTHMRKNYYLKPCLPVRFVILSFFLLFVLLPCRTPMFMKQHKHIDFKQTLRVNSISTRGLEQIHTHASVSAVPPPPQRPPTSIFSQHKPI